MVTIPPQQTTDTFITAALYNEIIDGLAHILNMTGQGGTVADMTAVSALGWDVGDMKVAARISDTGGQWLRADGRTIGNAASGGTARANADTSALFTVLWTNFTNTELVIEDSGGTPTTRGASAAADYAANKRMPLPDTRGRAVAGMDDPTGAAAADRITSAQGDVLGGVMGAETHTLITGEMPAHTHVEQYYASGAGLTTPGVANANATLTSMNAPTASTGGDGAHNNTQPSIFLNYFIYTGN